MPELRSMLDRLLHGYKKPAPFMPAFELVNSQSASFAPWSGNVYENDIARAAIWTIAEAAGKASFIHARGDGADMKVFPDPTIRAVLEQPNEFLTMQNLVNKMVVHLQEYNNAFALIIRDNRERPIAIYPLDYTTVELKESFSHDVYCKFKFRGLKDMTAPYHDIIHLRKHYNNDEFFGSSNKATLVNLMEIIDTTDQGMVEAVKNSAIIKWILKFRQTLTPSDIKKQVEEFGEQYLKSTAHGAGVVPADPRYDIEQVKTDSYVPNAPQLDRAKQRIYAYYGVNDAIVQRTYNEEGWNAWYELTIEPILIQLAQQLTTKFFSAKERAFQNRIYPESSNLMYAATATKLNLMSLVDRGAMTPNEWRRVFNFAPIEGGDKPIRRLDTQTVDDSGDYTNKRKTITTLNEEPIKQIAEQHTEESTVLTEERGGALRRANYQDWAFEVRAAQLEDGGESAGMWVEGRAIVFDTDALMYEFDGVKYYERILSGALDGADMSDVVMRYNHDPSNIVVARHSLSRPNRSTMQLMPDMQGLVIRADISKTEMGRQLYEAIQAGLVDKMSFAFMVGEERYDTPTHTRSIVKIKKLWEVSAVDNPAYDATSIYARDRFAAEAESEKKAADAAKARKENLSAQIQALTSLYGGTKCIGELK